MSNASAINLHGFSEEELTELSQLIYAEREYRNNGVISEGLEMIKKGLEKIRSVDRWFLIIPDIRVTDQDEDGNKCSFVTSFNVEEIYDHIKKTP